MYSPVDTIMLECPYKLMLHDVEILEYFITIPPLDDTDGVGVGVYQE